MLLPTQTQCLTCAGRIDQLIRALKDAGSKFTALEAQRTQVVNTNRYLIEKSEILRSKLNQAEAQVDGERLEERSEFERQVTFSFLKVVNHF